MPMFPRFTPNRATQDAQKSVKDVVREKKIQRIGTEQFASGVILYGARYGMRPSVSVAYGTACTAVVSSNVFELNVSFAVEHPRDDYQVIATDVNAFPTLYQVVRRDRKGFTLSAVSVFPFDSSVPVYRDFSTRVDGQLNYLVTY